MNRRQFLQMFGAAAVAAALPSIAAAEEVGQIAKLTLMAGDQILATKLLPVELRRCVNYVDWVIQSDEMVSGAPSHIKIEMDDAVVHCGFSGSPSSIYLANGETLTIDIPIQIPD